jgi:hypothetical protein
MRVQHRESFKPDGRRSGSRSYQLYGLRIRSPWKIPCPETSADRELADVELSRAPASLFEKVSAQGQVRSTAGSWVQHTPLYDGSTYLCWRELFEFLISADGRQVLGHPLQRASLEAFQTYLLGQVLSYAMLRFGIESIHATALVVDGEAFAILGDCGYGKSTLAAACLKAGHRLLTDDLLIVKEEGNGILAYPGPSRIKLFPRIARRLLGPQARGTPMNNLTHKLVIPLEAHQSCREAVPLKAIYVLRPPDGRPAPDKVTIRGMNRRQAIVSVIANTFNCTVREPHRLKQQLSHAARLVSHIPIKYLSYPRELARLSEVVGTLRADMAQSSRQR